MGNASMCKETPVVEDPSKVKNLKIAGKGGVLQLASDCKVRVCVVAYDYHGYGADAQAVPRLSCVRDGACFAKMAKDSGAEVSSFFDRLALNEGEKPLSVKFPTKQVVLDEWRRIGSEMTENDAFVFYFAGHGISRPREVEEGQEEMMIFMESDGTPSHLVDDEVAAVLTEAFPKDAHILFITDCFYNSTLTDLSRPSLAGRPIVHMAAVKDQRHLPTPPKGKQALKEEPSAFTQTLLETVEQLAQAPSAGNQLAGQEISVVEVYNKVLETYSSGFKNQELPATSEEKQALSTGEEKQGPPSTSEAKQSPSTREEKQAPTTAVRSEEKQQDLYFARTSKFDPDTFRWPLLPPPGWLIADPLEVKKPAKGLGMFACIG